MELLKGVVNRKRLRNTGLLHHKSLYHEYYYLTKVLNNRNIFCDEKMLILFTNTFAKPRVKRLTESLAYAGFLKGGGQKV